MTLVAEQTETTIAELAALRVQQPRMVIERYDGICISASITLFRDDHEKRDRLEFSAAPNVRMPQEVEELLFRASTLSRQVHLTFSSGRDRSLCLQMVYGVIAGIFRELDREAAMRAAGLEDEACARVKYLETALGRAEGYFRRASQRQAQLRYLGGMGGGLLVIALLGLVLSLGLSTLRDIDDQAPMFLVTLIAGGMGAVLSVLHGMTSGSLKLHTMFANAESSFGPLVAAGALRPLLGGLSGIVVYVLLQAKLVPLDIPEGDTGTHFFIALAIVAGFSERMARGVLAGTEERLGGAPAK